MDYKLDPREERQCQECGRWSGPHAPGCSYRDETYEDWIAGYVKSQTGNVRYRCQSASEAMAKAFPELRLARGWVTLESSDRLEHWWCVTPNGAVIDPTEFQFDDYRGAPESYEEYDEGKHGSLPTGKCPECGEFIYDGRDLHPECEQSYLAYLNGVTRGR